MPSSDAERLQLRMQRIRRRLDSNVEELISDAEQLLDWKYYLLRQPIPCAIAALIGGYFLVPSRRPVQQTKVFLDPDVSREIAERSDQVQVAPLGSDETESAVKTGLIGSLAATGLNLLIKTGLNYGTQYVRQMMLNEIAARSAADPVKEQRPYDVRHQ